MLLARPVIYVGWNVMFSDHGKSPVSITYFQSEEFASAVFV